MRAPISPLLNNYNIVSLAVSDIFFTIFDCDWFDLETTRRVHNTWGWTISMSIFMWWGKVEFKCFKLKYFLKMSFYRRENNIFQDMNKFLSPSFHHPHLAATKLVGTLHALGMNWQLYLDIIPGPTDLTPPGWCRTIQVGTTHYYSFWHLWLVDWNLSVLWLIEWGMTRKLTNHRCQN